MSASPKSQDPFLTRLVNKQQLHCDKIRSLALKPSARERETQKKNNNKNKKEPVVQRAFSEKLSVMAVERLCFSITIFIWLHYRLAHILISTGTKSGPFPLTASICSTLSNMLTLRNSAPSAHRSNSQPSSGPLRSNYNVINVFGNCAHNCGRVCALVRLWAHGGLSLHVTIQSRRLESSEVTGHLFSLGQINQSATPLIDDESPAHCSPHRRAHTYTHAPSCKYCPQTH